MPTEFDFILTDILAYQSALSRATSKQKENHVPTPTAQQFNALLDRIKAEKPELAPRLPDLITFGSEAARFLDASDITYLDLEISVERIIGLLQLYKSHR